MKSHKISTMYFDDFGFNLDVPNRSVTKRWRNARAETQSRGGDYGDRLPLRWLTFHHFAGITGKTGIGVTPSNMDSLFLQLGDNANETTGYIQAVYAH
jgi:hypothetical protein